MSHDVGTVSPAPSVTTSARIPRQCSRSTRTTALPPSPYVPSSSGYRSAIETSGTRQLPAGVLERAVVGGQIQIRDTRSPHSGGVVVHEAVLDAGVFQT